MNTANQKPRVEADMPQEHDRLHIHILERRLSGPKVTREHYQRTAGNGRAIDGQTTGEHAVLLEQHHRDIPRPQEGSDRGRDPCRSKKRARRMRSIAQVHGEDMRAADEAIRQSLKEIEESCEQAYTSRKRAEEWRQKLEKWLDAQCRRLEERRKELEDWREKAEEWWEVTEESREGPLSYQKWYAQSYIEAYQFHFQRRYQHRYHMSQPANSKPPTQAARESYVAVYAQDNEQWYEKWFAQWYTRSFPLVSHRLYVGAYKDAFSKWYIEWYPQWCQNTNPALTRGPKAPTMPARDESLEQGESASSSSRQGSPTPPSSVDGETVPFRQDMAKGCRYPSI